MMRKYEKYKDSGVEWIGEIPEHWEIQRLKYNALIILGKMLMSNPPKGEEFKYTLEKYLKSKNIGWLQVFNGSKDVDEMWGESEYYEYRQYTASYPYIRIDYPFADDFIWIRFEYGK